MNRGEFNVVKVPGLRHGYVLFYPGCLMALRVSGRPGP
ncbi:hypothetical protein D088_970107 [Salmonella enterica subsp. houtenae serovar 16:z4,z32:-- str. RKS3027]|nr:hypothetical protein D088_970107 [Salmonella enterica subsp. houtenae serovar 16:z4,z32:-- str. RKS3027]